MLKIIAHKLYNANNGSIYYYKPPHLDSGKPVVLYRDQHGIFRVNSKGRWRR